jgi:serralysin
LTVRVLNGDTSDRIGIAETGTVHLSRSDDGFQTIAVNGVQVGFVALSANAAAALELQFNENARTDLVQEVLRALTYKTVTPFTGVRQISIKFTDPSLLSSEVSVLVQQQINAKPSAIGLSGTFVKELASNGALVGALTAADPNSGDVISFQLLDDSRGRFALDGNKLVVKHGTKLDYEQARSHNVTVRATDKHGLFHDQDFSIAVSDVGRERMIGTIDGDRAIGGRGADRFFGKLGNDVLTGGRGRDIFGFDTAINRQKTNVDRITDFNARDDRMDLSQSVFTKIAKKGVLAHSSFWEGPMAHAATDRIVYNKKTGALFYDPDGNGHAAAIQFATLTNKAAISEKDFYLV